MYIHVYEYMIWMFIHAYIYKYVHIYVFMYMYIDRGSSVKVKHLFVREYSNILEFEHE